MGGRYVPNFAMSLNDMAYIDSATKKPLDVHLLFGKNRPYGETLKEIRGYCRRN